MIARTPAKFPKNGMIPARKAKKEKLMAHLIDSWLFTIMSHSSQGKTKKQQADQYDQDAPVRLFDHFGN